MKIQSFLRNLSWLVVLNLLVKPLWVFGIDRKVQNAVGHAAFGTYFSILNLAIILAILADAGLTNLLNRQLAQGQQLPIGRYLRYKLLLSAGYLAVLAMVCQLSSVTRWDLVGQVALLQLGASFLLFYRNILTGHQQFRTDAWLSVADKALMILLCAPLLYLPFAGGIRLESFLWIQIAGTFAALLLAMYLARRHHTLPLNAGLKTSGIFRQSAPFVLLILLMGLHTRLDAFLLERLHPQGALEAGIYAAAYRLLDAGNTIGYMSASFLVPFIARHLEDRALVNATVLRLRHGLLAAALGFCALCWGLAPAMMQLLYHTDSVYEQQVLKACVAVLPAYYGIHLYGSTLTASNRLRDFTWIMLSATGINIALNLLLIEPYGALGCCYAALASQYACALGCFLRARQRFGLKVHLPSLLGYLGLGSVLLAATLLLQRVPLPAFLLPLLAAIAATLLMFVILNRVRRARVRTK